MNDKTFTIEAKRLGIVLEKNQLQLFAKYYQFLVQENEKYNLTSITDESEVYEKHFLDCIALIHATDFSHKRVVDLGSGAGFPLIPLKILDPTIDATALDATAKKTFFVDQLAQELDLKDVHTITGRAEDYKGEPFDVVLARGIAPLNVLLELACNLVKPKGFLAIMKGTNYRQEITDAASAINTLGYKITKVQEVKLPESGLVHFNMTFQKIHPHNSKYPRSYAKIKSKPL